MAEVNILIVDDDPLFATETGILLQDLGYSKVKTIRSADAKLNLIESHTPDLILFSLSSANRAADLAQATKLQEARIPMVFLAEQHDQESFEQAKWLEPYGFLFRPFDKLNLHSTIQIAFFHNHRKHLTTQLVQGWRNGAMPSDVLFVKSNNKLFRVRLLDIVVIEAEGNYSILNTTQKKYAVKTSLKQLKRKLAPQLFVQIHRNYIVQIPYVDSIDITSGEVHLNNKNYPIGGKFKNEFIKKLNQL